jgi:hypothetical protein
MEIKENSEQEHHVEDAKNRLAQRPYGRKEKHETKLGKSLGKRVTDGERPGC